MNKICVALVVLLYPLLGLTQNSIAAKIQIGYSNPTSLYKSYAFSAYEVEGKMSQSLSLSYQKKMDFHTVRFQSGISFLGFKSRSFLGFTPHPFFPSVKDGSPILAKFDYNIGYWDNSIGYGIDMNSKVNFTLSIHYLLNTISKIREVYTFTDATITNQTTYSETIYNDLKKKGYSFYSHFAVSGDIKYSISKNIYIGCNYLVGLSEFNPFLQGYREKSRLNQNFSLTAEYKLWNSKRKQKT